jgi:hypothetical protein
MALNNQLSYERKMIREIDRSLLWINLSAPSVGDSIMDLSGRVLLSNKNIHLLTDKKNAALYKSDIVFSKVASSPSELDDNYDLILIDSYSHRCLSPKLARWKDVPFVGIYGYLNGFEVHRTLYSHYRIAELIGMDLNAVRPNVCISLDKSLSVPSPDMPYVTVSVGAEWEYRHYPHWLPIIEFLVKSVRVVLVGSSNGVLEASVLEGCVTVENLVGKLTLVETAQVISKAKFHVCADGGLWHVACGLNVPSVCMFADCQLFLNGLRVLRNTQFQRCIPLYADRAVSEIHPDLVIQAIKNCKSSYDI